MYDYVITHHEHSIYKVTRLTINNKKFTADFEKKKKNGSKRFII